MDTSNAPDLDPLQQLLLAQLAGDPIPAVPSMDHLLANRPEDPMTAAVLDALRRRREREALVEDNESASGASEVDGAEAEQAEGVVPDPGVADVLRRLYDEVAALRTRHKELADALGACATCWGDGGWCSRCHRRGVPGGRVPVEGEFAKYVLPAVERRKAHRAGAMSALGPTTASAGPPVRDPVSLT